MIFRNWPKTLHITNFSGHNRSIGEAKIEFLAGVDQCINHLILFLSYCAMLENY